MIHACMDVMLVLLYVVYSSKSKLPFSVCLPHLNLKLTINKATSAIARGDRRL